MIIPGAHKPLIREYERRRTPRRTNDNVRPGSHRSGADDAWRALMPATTVPLGHREMARETTCHMACGLHAAARLLPRRLVEDLPGAPARGRFGHRLHQKPRSSGAAAGSAVQLQTCGNRPVEPVAHQRVLSDRRHRSVFFDAAHLGVTADARRHRLAAVHGAAAAQR